MTQTREQFIPINGYEGLYEVSNLGTIKSLPKEWIIIGNNICKKKCLTLKQGIGNDGYKIVVLSKNRKRKTLAVHRIVWDHFGDRPRNGKKLQVDHKDENKINNNINNLQLLSCRENISKYHRHKKYSSEYIGVHWCSRDRIWIASISINCKRLNLGRFTNEINAHIAYQKALGELL